MNQDELFFSLLDEYPSTGHKPWPLAVNDGHKPGMAALSGTPSSARANVFPPPPIFQAEMSHSAVGVDRGPPRGEPIGQRIDIVDSWIKTKVIFKLVPEQFANLRWSSAGKKYFQHRRDQAVVLVRRQVGHSDGIPLVEQEPEVGLSTLDVHRAIVPWGAAVPATCAIR